MNSQLSFWYLMLCVLPQLLNRSGFLVLNIFVQLNKFKWRVLPETAVLSPGPSKVLVLGCRCCLARPTGRWSSWTATAGCWPTCSCTSPMASSACLGTAPPSWWRTAARATQTQTTTPRPKVGSQRRGRRSTVGTHRKELRRSTRQGGLVPGFGSAVFPVPSLFSESPCSWWSSIGLGFTRHEMTLVMSLGCCGA